MEQEVEILTIKLNFFRQGLADSQNLLADALAQNQLLNRQLEQLTAPEPKE